MPNQISLTVVIASHRPQMIPDLLNALYEQNIGIDTFETVVVCDYRPDKLQESYSKVKWVYLDDNSISAKRNLGVTVSTGEIIAFTDDDCIPFPDWISQGLKYLNENKNCWAVEGFTCVEENPDRIGMHRDAKQLELPGMRTNNIFYRKNAFVKAGGFDSRFTVQREDTDLAFSVLELGGQIDYCSKIRVKHRFRHWEYWDMLKNCWNRRFDPLLFVKHPRLYLRHLKSPLNVSMLIQILFYALYLVPVSIVKKRWIFMIHILLIAVLGFRRSGIVYLFRSRFFMEIISVAVAPFVSIGALIYGFLRLRKE